MLTKIVKFDIKAVTGNGIEGWASVFNHRDLGGDIIEPGAFARTLNNRRKSGQPFPMLWNHNSDEPIGVWDPKDMDETKRGLKVKGSFVESVRRAQEVRDLAKAKALGGLSIGYDIPRGKSTVTRNDDGTGYTRIIKEIRLWEISPVTFPMNLRAKITDVKCTSCGEDNAVWYDGVGGWDGPDTESPLILPEDVADTGKPDSAKSCGCQGSPGAKTSDADSAELSSLFTSLERFNEELRR